MKKLLLTTLAGFAIALCFGQQQANRIDKKDKSCNSHCSHDHKKAENTLIGKTGCMLDEGISNYMTYILSYEKNTIDGTLDITAIIEAEDTTYIGNVFTFETLCRCWCYHHRCSEDYTTD